MEGRWTTLFTTRMRAAGNPGDGSLSPPDPTLSAGQSPVEAGATSPMPAVGLLLECPGLNPARHQCEFIRRELAEVRLRAGLLLDQAGCQPGHLR